jgi:UDP-N-acetylmuramoylalanine--D-glutamate ligase
VLIAGGDGKGQDFTPLVSPIKQYARAVVVLGKDADLIAATLDGQGVLVEHAASLESATEIASRLAQAGDAVLLSPACSSLDMFRNYEHRAQVFTHTVHELAIQAGQLC